MSNNNQPNKQESSNNVSPMFPYPPSPMTSVPPSAAMYQSYMQAAMYAIQQQQFFQQMFSVPPPPLPTSNIPNRPSTNIRPPVSTGRIFHFT